jgi:hypothetical protein
MLLQTVEQTQKMKCYVKKFLLLYSEATTEVKSPLKPHALILDRYYVMTHLKILNLPST